MCPPCNPHASQTKRKMLLRSLVDQRLLGIRVSTFFRIPTPLGIFAKPSRKRTENLTQALPAEGCMTHAMQVPSNRTECDKNSSDPRHLRPPQQTFLGIQDLRLAAAAVSSLSQGIPTWYKIVRTGARRREMALKQNQAFALCQSLWPFARVRVIVITTKHVGPRAGRKGTRQEWRKASSQDAAR